MAGANGRLREVEPEITGLKRMNESLIAQKAEIEQQLKDEAGKEKVKDERIA